MKLTRASHDIREELFSQLVSVLGQMGHFGPPNCTKKVPEWAKMTYNCVFYLWEVFYGHFDPSRMSWEALVNFIQCGSIFDQNHKIVRRENFYSWGTKKGIYHH